MAQIELLKPEFFGSERGGLHIDMSDQEPPDVDEFDRAVHLTLPDLNKPGRKFRFRYIVFDKEGFRRLVVFPPDISYPKAYHIIQRSDLAGDLRAAGRLVVDRRHDEPTIRTLIRPAQDHLLDMVLPLDNDQFVQTVLANQLGPRFGINF